MHLVPQGDTADEQLLSRQRYMLADDVVIIGEGGLGAGVQVTGPGCQHEGLDEHANVYVAPGTQAAVEAYQQAHRGIEEAEVPQLLQPTSSATARGHRQCRGS
ncbi:hypothetical protein D3C76_1572040 [compost metagenome]